MAEIREGSLSELIPDDKNMNRHTPYGMSLIEKSIRENGLGRSILVDKDNRIIGGNGVVETAAAVGMENTIVVETTGDKLVVVKRTDVSLDSKQGRSMAMADNATAVADIDWDAEAVQEVVDEWGIEPQDWGVVLDELDEEVNASEDDFNEETDNVESVCKIGEVWKLGRHRLMCGDSTDLEQVKKLLGGAKIDMVFTDPPYGINVVSCDGKVGADFGIAKKGDYKKVIADETTDTAQKACDILLTISDKVIVWGGNYFTKFLPFSDSWLIWDKRCDSDIRNTFADGEMAWCSFHTPIRIYHQLWNGMIREGEHDKRVHPTQKPIAMLGNVISDFSTDGSTILDVFGGSGSTLMACEQLNRNCYMMELDPHYCDVIIARWEKMTGGKAVKIDNNV